VPERLKPGLDSVYEHHRTSHETNLLSVSHLPAPRCADTVRHDLNFEKDMSPKGETNHLATILPGDQK